MLPANIVRIAYCSVSLPDFQKAFTAICSVFDPLTKGVDSIELGENLYRFAALSREDATELLTPIGRLVRKPNLSRPCVLAIDDQKIAIWTVPTDIKILVEFIDGHVTVTVDFGKGQFMESALAMIAAAELSEIKFMVYALPAVVRRSDLRDALLTRAVKKLDDARSAADRDGRPLAEEVERELKEQISFFTNLK